MIIIIEKYLKQNKILLSVILVLFILLIYLIINPNIKTIEKVITKECEVIDNHVSIKVEIKGAILNPGVYEVDSNSRVIDQTTPNMIQRISGIFQRNPLISMGI